MVICLERGADLHMVQLMPLPLAVSSLSKIQIGFTFLVPAHPNSPGQRAIKRVCVYPLYMRLPTLLTGLESLCLQVVHAYNSHFFNFTVAYDMFISTMGYFRLNVRINDLQPENISTILE